MTTNRVWTTMSLARAAHVTPQRIQMLCVTEQLPGAVRDTHGRWRIPHASGQAYLAARRARARAHRALQAVREEVAIEQHFQEREALNG
jgi:hypothetical protein